MDTYYPQRPEELEECCLYDFKKYGINSNGKRIYQKLAKPIIPNHRIFDPNKEDQREDYECDLIESGQTAEEAFNHFITTRGEMSDHHGSLQSMLKAQSKVHKINENRAENEVTAKDEKEQQEGVDIPGVAAAAMDDVRDCDAARIQMLNADQRRIFNNVNDHLMHQYRHEQGECNCNTLNPINMFISVPESHF